MNVRGQLIAIAVLAACTAGLAQAVRYLWTEPLMPPAPPPAVASGELPLQLPDQGRAELPPPPSLELSEILERPLFSPTRRPPVRPPEPVAEPPPVTQVVTFVQEEPQPAANPVSELQNLRLIGVLQADEHRRALITTPEDPEGTWLAEGQGLLGWRIVAIAPNKIEIVSGEERHTLSLYAGE